MTQTIEQLKILFPNICHVRYQQFYKPITAAVVIIAILAPDTPGDFP